MKTLNNYIVEKLRINKPKSTSIVRHTLFPNNRKELLKMVRDEIKQNGNDCSLNHIDTSKITDIGHLFSGTEFNGDISQWDVSKVKIMRGTFYDSIFDGDISQWDVSSVQDMECMFYHSHFNGDISLWDVSKVKHMEWMFAHSYFNDDISEWNVINVESMYSMFRHSDFNQDISKWQIKKNCDTKHMFLECGTKQSYKPYQDGNRIE